MWHNLGKVNVTKGSDVVTGVGTKWVESVRVGDAFQGPDGKLYQVINVASDEALAISPAYEGSTATNLNYWIVPIPGYSKTQADRLSLIISKLDGDIVTANDAAEAAQSAALQAQQWRNEAAASAAAALQSEQSAALFADIAEQARDDAVSVVTEGQGSIEPKPGKFPVAGADAAIQQAWIKGLEFELDVLRVAKNKALYGDGPYPSLDLQFAGATIPDPRISFNRASKATYWDKDGVLREADIDEPRFAYDPVTGEALGLLLEPFTSTNIARQSSGRIVSDDGSTYQTENEAVAPTGEVVNSIKGAFNNHYGVSKGSRLEIFWGSTLGADNYHTLSFFYKPVTDISSVQLNKWTTVGIGTDSDGVFIKEVGNGWFYFSETFTYKGNGESKASLIINKGESAPSDETPEIFIAGVQMEKGRFPTSYIPTSGTQVTRAADYFSLPVGDWYRQDRGTLLVDVVVLTSAGGGGSVANLHTDRNAYISVPGVYSTDVHNMARVRINGQNTDTTELLPRTKFGERLVSAISWDDSGFVYAGNGNVSDAEVSPGGYPNPVELKLFVQYNGNWSNSGETPSGIIRRIAYYPRRLTDAQLISLTELTAL